MITMARSANPASVPRDHPPTARQVAAVRAVMQLFVEEDLESGVSPRRQMRCTRCARPRPLPGFLLYDGVRLCNACATDFELARIRGTARTAAEFLLVPPLTTER